MFIFSRQKTQGICLKILKLVFTQGIYLQHGDYTEVLKIKGCTRFEGGCFYNFCRKWNEVVVIVLLRELPAVYRWGVVG